MTSSRRLAAILAADIAGYSALMERDEAGTVAALKAHQAALLPLISELGGRVIDLAGDGILAEFASAVAAVECALRIQSTMAERNAEVPTERAMRFRIGVNLGDVVFDETRLYGDGVNVAARLEAIAEPGGIVVSATVHDQVAGKIDANFVRLGEKSLKNIGRKVDVFAVVQSTSGAPAPSMPVRSKPVRRTLAAGGLLAAALALGIGAWFLFKDVARPAPPAPVIATASPATPSPTEPSLPRRLSLVVLPFANLSADPEQEYLADGITEDVTADISRIPGTLVIARNTAFTYKGRAVDVRQVGRDLNVRYVVEGSVRRLGETIRLSAQLSDTSSGVQLWTDRFDIARGRLSQLDGMISVRIARALDIALVSAEARRPRSDAPTTPDAEDLILRGLASLNGAINRESIASAQDLLQQALVVAPHSADAHALLAQAYFDEYFWFPGTRTREDLRALSERHAQAALSINPLQFRAHFVQGMAYDQTRQFERALASFDRSIGLNPSFVYAYSRRAFSRLGLGQPEEAIADVEQAFLLSPRDRNTSVWLWYAGIAHLMMNRHEQAVQSFERAIDVNRGAYAIYPLLVLAYVRSGRSAEAQATLAEYRRLRPQASIALLRRGFDLSDHPRYVALQSELYGTLRTFGLPEQ